MKVALVNPAWDFTGSIYFGCREPHLPLELGYTQAMLRAAGHDTLMLDGYFSDLSAEAMCRDIQAFGADITVVTTAPSYLFWRCAPPELSVPARFLRQLGSRGGRTVAVGPHGSVTPRRDAAQAWRGCGGARRMRGGRDRARRHHRTGHALPRSPIATGRACMSPAVRRPRGSSPHRRCTGRHRGSPAITIIITGSMPTTRGLGAEVEASRGCPVRLQLLREDRFPRSISPSGTCRWCWRRSTR